MSDVKKLFFGLGLGLPVLLVSCGGGSGGTTAPSTPFTLTNFLTYSWGSAAIKDLPERNEVKPIFPLKFSNSPSEDSLKKAVKITNTATGQAVPFVVSVPSDSGEALVVVPSPLNYDTKYNFSVTTEAIDAFGRHLDKTYSKDFLTELTPYKLGVVKIDVLRYNTTDLTVTIRNMGDDSILSAINISATCQEDGYSGVKTYFKGSVNNLAPSEYKDFKLAYTGGYAYFTNQTVRCSFSAEVADKSRSATIN